ncbi:Hypothetical protein FKW44_012906, partial [Caligus rogercresseyi]
CNITLGWNKGHNDNTGNEFADTTKERSFKRIACHCPRSSMCQCKGARRESNMNAGKKNIEN